MPLQRRNRNKLVDSLCSISVQLVQKKTVSLIAKGYVVVDKDFTRMKESVYVSVDWPMFLRFHVFELLTTKATNTNKKV